MRSIVQRVTEVSGASRKYVTEHCLLIELHLNDSFHSMYNIMWVFTYKIYCYVLDRVLGVG